MEYRDRELELAETRILDMLEHSDKVYSPKQLVEEMVALHEEDVSEEAITVALWDLIGRTDVVLTRDWKLNLKKPAAAV